MTKPASFIWLRGFAGCGKTILSSTVIQSVLEHCEPDPGKVAAYFYFDFNDGQKQVPELMIKSLISQLSQQCVRVPEALAELYSSCGNGQRQPSLESLLGLLKQMIEDFPTCYIIVDALDESGDRMELMDILERMRSWGIQNAHLLVTSRQEREIERSLRDLVDERNTISLQSTAVDQDINLYVHQRLSNDKSLTKWNKDVEIRQEIEKVLMEKARGMYLRPLLGSVYELQLIRKVGFDGPHAS